MNISDIKHGQLVKAKCAVNEGAFGPEIQPGTIGIVTAIKKYDNIYVEFEIGKQSLTRPILCHPIYLEKA